MELIPPPILLLEVPQDYNASSAVPCLFIHSIYVIPCLYIRSLSVMLSRISFHFIYGRSFKTLCLLNYALMIRHDYDITVFFTKRGVTIMVSEPGFETVGSKDLTCEDWMVNTRTDADLSAAIQNALQTLLPQIRAEIREEFRTSSGLYDSGGNPPPISHMEKILYVMGCEDAFKTRLAVYKFKGNALAWWKAYKQAKGGDAWLITNALQALLPQIRAEIHEELRTSSGPSDAGRNPPPITIHTCLERFYKQKPHSFEKVTAPVDAENWISHMDKIFDVMGCEDVFKTRLVVYKFEGNAFAW
nr:zinc finger, CCHC-type, retrotransposon Gag domain protein [Tanacetum cinerariifolium]